MTPYTIRISSRSVWTMRFKRILNRGLVVSSAATLLCAAPPAKNGGNSGSSGNSSSPQSQSQSSGTTANGAFESVMLSYGALDQTMQALARRACAVATGAAGDQYDPLIVIADQASLANLAAYDSFYSTARFLVTSFKTMAGLATPAAAGAGIDTFADITNAVAAVLIASNTETASSVTIQDASAAIKLSQYLLSDSTCKAQVAYPGIYGSGGGPISDIEGTYRDLSSSRNEALGSLPAIPAPPTPAPAQVAAFNTLDASYNLFLQSLFAVNGTTGQSGLAPIVQGFGLRQLLQAKNRQVYIVYVNVAAAGGTQRTRKNALTSLVTGDFISYSGGVIVNTMIFRKSDSPKILYTDVLRYRTPLTRIRSPIGKRSTGYGDNLGDTCRKGDQACVKALSEQ
jgi:hypothetical protein